VEQFTGFYNTEITSYGQFRQHNIKMCIEIAIVFQVYLLLFIPANRMHAKLRPSPNCKKIVILVTDDTVAEN